MIVIAKQTGYWDTIRNPGDEFEVPDDTVMAPWFAAKAGKGGRKRQPVTIAPDPNTGDPGCIVPGDPDDTAETADGASASDQSVL